MVKRDRVGKCFCSEKFYKVHPWQKYCSTKCRTSFLYKRRKKKGRRDDILRKFGIDSKEFRRILNSQKGVCAICCLKETAKSANGKRTKLLAVDHSHKTKKNRGLLCMKCNNGLGNFKDNPVLLLRAIEYLMK